MNLYQELDILIDATIWGLQSNFLSTIYFQSNPDMLVYDEALLHKQKDWLRTRGIRCGQMDGLQSILTVAEGGITQLENGEWVVLINNRVPDTEVSLVLMHEMAHVQCNDHLKPTSGSLIYMAKIEIIAESICYLAMRAVGQSPLVASSHYIGEYWDTNYDSSEGLRPFFQLHRKTIIEGAREIVESIEIVGSIRVPAS